MGVEPFLVASALECVVAQRLARMLCPNCKRRMIIPAKVLQESGYKARVELEAYEPVGCRRCGGSGYRGRVGLYEVMKITPEIQTMALERRPAEAMRDVAVAQGMMRLRDDGLQKVRRGGPRWRRSPGSSAPTECVEFSSIAARDRLQLRPARGADRAGSWTSISQTS